MDSSDQNVLGNQIAGMSVETFRSTTTLFTHTTHTHTRTTFTTTTTHTHTSTTYTTTTEQLLNQLFSNSEAVMLSIHTSNLTFQKIRMHNVPCHSCNAW